MNYEIQIQIYVMGYIKCNTAKKKKKSENKVKCVDISLYNYCNNNSGVTIKRNVKMIMTKQITFDVLAVFSRAL